MKFVLFSMFTFHAAAFYLTTTAEKPIFSLSEPTAHIEPTRTPAENAPVTLPTSARTSTITFSSLMTIAPLSRNPLELRQRCYNDQGFSVDCATWTGYYYTWGGSGHPYDGGPGSNSNGNGNGNNAITGIVGSANRVGDDLRISVVVILVTLCLLIIL